MKYYLVYPAHPGYHGATALTYHSELDYPDGSVVEVPLLSRQVLGVISKATTKPVYKTKPITHKDGPTLGVPNTLVSLAGWLVDYYAAPVGACYSLITPAGWTKKVGKSTVAETLQTEDEPDLPILTPSQRQAIQIFNQPDTDALLLHGDTGSGKTRAYIEMICDTLKLNKSSIVLTPEISLVPQLTSSLTSSFGGAVISIHSRLTTAKRREIWHAIASSSRPLIIVGPRSALFSPVKDLGLIIMDEAHEPSYKQDSTPRYHTFRVAGRLRQLTGSKLVLGTATPLVADVYFFEQKNLPIAKMPSITRSRTVSIVDSKDKSLFTRSRFLSDLLIEKISHANSSGKQALLYLNRRGTARVISCQDCSWQMQCKNCDTLLTYHDDSHKAICHLCGTGYLPPPACPQCHENNITYQSVGTKAIATEVSRLLPSAKIERFDSDNLQADRFEQRYQQIKSGAADIIIGTQLLAKGLDLPKLSVVGIIQADTSLSMPDYTADERTYQLLYQVIGRVGRTHGAGDVVVQSMKPDSPVITAATNNDSQGFYSSQLEQRRSYNFPPFVHMLKITCSRKTAKAAENALKKLHRTLSSQPGISLGVPAPCFIEKQRGNYHWQLVIRTKKRPHLLQSIQKMPTGFTTDLDPMSLL